MTNVETYQLKIKLQKEIYKCSVSDGSKLRALKAIEKYEAIIRAIS